MTNVFSNYILFVKVMNKDKKYIFIISDGLDNYLDLLKFEADSFIIWCGEIGQLLPALSNINRDIEREELLVISRKKRMTDKFINKIINNFSMSFNFTTPYVLYVDNFFPASEEMDKILNGENFFFYIDDNMLKNCFDSIKYNYILFVRLVFDKLTTNKRLNFYIMDSFQTIVDSELITRQKEEIEVLNKEITELSKIDYLTNVLNRRAFFEALEMEKKRAIRNKYRLEEEKRERGEAALIIDTDNEYVFEGTLEDHYGRFTCILIDIDFFKKINDKYGHVTGDTVLRKVGEVLTSRNIFRENDIVGRYGGEEFIIILPETNSKHALRPAERLREFIKEIEFYDNEKRVFNITISVGISEFSIFDKTNEELIKRADEALYYAKSNGRDRVVLYEDIFGSRS